MRESTKQAADDFISAARRYKRASMLGGMQGLLFYTSVRNYAREIIRPADRLLSASAMVLDGLTGQLVFVTDQLQRVTDDIQAAGSRLKADNDAANHATVDEMQAYFEAADVDSSSASN